MINKQNLLLTAIISVSLSLVACGSDSKPKAKKPTTMTTVLYNLTQSEYGKIDAKKLTIDEGTVTNETIYRATGSGYASPELLKIQRGYVIGNQLFAENTNAYQNSRYESILFGTDRIIEEIESKESRNSVKISTKLNILDLSGYQPYSGKYLTIFSDWQDKTTNNQAPDWILNIQFPQGSKCYQKAEMTTNKDVFIINSEADKTVATDLIGLKMIIARMDAKSDDLEVSGEFTDVLVGSKNQLPATSSPTKRLFVNNGNIESVYFNGGGVVVNNSAYQAILHKAGHSLNVNPHLKCNFYNATASEYIFEQFKQYAH